MSYWKYKSEQIRKDWHNFIHEIKQWWKNYRAAIIFAAPFVLIIGGTFGFLINTYLGAGLLIFGFIWLIIFIAYVSINDELTEFRKWQKEQKKEKQL